MQRVRHLPVFLLMTFRPDFVSPWENRPHVKTLVLERLPQGDCMQLAKAIAGASQVPSGVLTGSLPMQMVCRSSWRS